MAENDRINTMREAMIRELFADIDGLADRIGALQRSLPAVAAEIEAQLRPLRDDLTVIVGQLDAETKRMVGEGKAALKGEGYDQGKKLEARANALLDQHASKVRELVSKSVAESVQQPVRDAVTQVMAVSKELNAALMEIKKATISMQTVAGHTVQGFAKDLDQAAKRVSWSWWEILGGMAIAMCASTVFLLGVGKWLGVIVTKSEITNLTTAQKSIYSKLEEIKPSRK